MAGSEINIAGYTYGKVARSPVSLREFAELEQSASFTEDDREALARLGQILVPQAEAMVDGWRKKIAKQPHLVKWFFGPDAMADDDYKARVKPRFVRWIIDLCTRPFDQAWLDYQHEIGLRHTPARKNATDNAKTPPLVPLRYLLAFTAEIIVAAEPRLRSAGLSEQELRRQYQAWTKAVLLSVTLWSKAYTLDDLW